MSEQSRPERLPRAVATLFISLFCWIIFSTSAFGALAGSAAPTPYLTLSPDQISTWPGARVTLYAAINSRLPVNDELIWIADHGRVEVVRQPSPPFVEGITYFYAPDEPGIYTVKAFSRNHKQHYDSVEIRVTGRERLVLRSAPSLIFENPGDSAKARATRLFINGTTDPDPSIEWTSSNPNVATVDAAGVVVARATSGSAVITGQAAWLDPVHITVTMAQLKSSARLVDQEHIHYVWNNHLLIDGNTTRPVFGQTLVAGIDGGLLGRVTAVQNVGPDYWVTYAEARLPEAFRSLKVERLGVPLLDADVDPGEARAKLPLSFECSHSFPSDSFTLEAGTLSPEVGNLALNLVYELEEESPPKLAIWLSGDFQLNASGAYMSLELTAGITLDCRQAFGPKAFGSLPIGPVFVGGTLTPFIGMELEVGAVGTLRFNAPSLQYSINNISHGFGFNGERFYSIRGAANGELRVFYPDGVSPVETSVELSAELRPYAGGALGLGITAGGLDGYAFDFMDLKGYGFVTAGILNPFDLNDIAYAGPFMHLGLGAYAGMDPLLDNPLLGAALRLLGVERLLDVDPELYSWRSNPPLVISPRVTLIAGKDESASPPQAVFEVKTLPAEPGARVDILSWPKDDTSAAPTLQGTRTLDGNGEAEVRIPWPAEEILVSARVYDDHFGAVNLPYAPGTVQSGGNSPPDCDGPECPDTSPGGPSWIPGGGFGAPGDNGDPNYSPPTVGGGGVGGPGGSSGPGDHGGDGGVEHGSGAIDFFAGSTGDPHMISVDGLRFNFQAEGDFVLAGQSAGLQYLGYGDLEVQVRQKQIHPGLQGAINTAVGARVGSDTVQIYAVPYNGSHLHINGSPATAPIALEGGGGQIFVDGSKYTLVWTDGSRLRVNLGYQHLDLMLALSPTRQGRISGLLGYLDQDRANDFVTRYGAVLEPPINFYQLYDVLGESWRLESDSVEAIIEAPWEIDHPDLSFPGSFPPADISPELLAEAEQLCQEGGVYIRGVLQACRYDVAVLLTELDSDDPLIQSIIEGHYLSQGDLFGDGDQVEVYFAARPWIAGGQTATFSASVHGTANTAVTWTVTGGTIVGAGNTLVWQAPSVGGSYQITATSVEDPTQSSSANVQVVPEQGQFGFSAVDWRAELQPCDDGFTCDLVVVDDFQDSSGDGHSVRFEGRMGYGATFITDVDLNLAPTTDRLVFYLKLPSINPGWQKEANLRLRSAGGVLELTPIGHVVDPSELGTWVEVHAPLAGGELEGLIWQATTQGNFDVSELETVEITVDPGGNPTVAVRLDNLRFE